MMKKIYTFLMLTMVSTIALATPSFTVSTDTIDFGTVYLDENGLAEATEHFTVTWSDLLEYDGVELQIKDTVDDEHYAFALSIVNLYGGDEHSAPAEPDVWLYFLGDKPGTYTCNIRLSVYLDYSSYLQKEQIVPVTIRVEEALTTAIEDVQRTNVQCTKVLRDGQLYLMYKGHKYNVQGIETK